MTATQIPLDLKSVPVLGRDDFFVSGCNELAFHWIEKWPLGWHPFPAFIVYGPRGSGKSHLADVWADRSKAIRLGPQVIMDTPLDDIFAQNRNLVIDRIDLLIGARDWEEKLFHIYNFCGQNNLYLLGLSHVAPEQMVFTVNDLGSRLRAAPHAAISTPDDDVLLKVMARRFHDQGYMVAEGALQFALTRMERSWEALDHLIDDAIMQAMAQKKQITIPLLRDLMLRSELL